MAAVRREGVRCCRASPRPPADPLLHLGGLVPGDDPRADRGGSLRAGSTTLIGLKENVIVGRLIPAGTGSVINRLKQIAAERDHQLRREEPATLSAIEEEKASEVA